MTMPHHHVVDEIGAYIEHTLDDHDAQRVRTHLGECLDCRRAYDSLRDGIDAIRQLPVFEPPADVWSGITRALDDAGHRRESGSRIAAPVAPEVAPAVAARRWTHVAVAAGIVIIAGASATYFLGLYHSSWSIERLAGAPVAGSRTIVQSGELGEGEWLETDNQSRARVSIGRLGRADVGPGSRVKLVQAGGVERALRIERGSIDARVWAPPRFFLVETPAATAIDLGCIYTLDVDERGNGVLSVRSGQVELGGSGRRSLVVAGTAAAMRAGKGPGTPYSEAESQAFRDALAIVDFGDGDRFDALTRVLSLATARSTITLWHLLPRVSPEERVRVFDRLAILASHPAGAERDAVLSLDADALSSWRRTLEPSWSTERVRLWKRAWRAVWSLARGT